jgi:septal ring-binding cell division protein DamX
LHTFLLLIAALAGSGWHCTEDAGLWDCRPNQPAPRVAAQVEPKRAMPAVLPTEPEPVPDPEPDIERKAEPGAESNAESNADPEADTAGQPGDEGQAEPEPRLEPTPAPADSPADAGAEAAELLGENTYIVQIGAYRNREAAYSEARRLAYSGMVVVNTHSDGKDWFVLLLGTYPSWTEAREAGLDYEATEGGSYWVRTARDLQQVLKP